MFLNSFSVILAARRSVAEGVTSSISVTELAARLGVDMPISAAVKAILHDGAAIAVIVSQTLWTDLGKPRALRLVAQATRGVAPDAEAALHRYVDQNPGLSSRRPAAPEQVLGLS